MAALRRDETGPIHTKNLVIPTSYTIPTVLYFEQTLPGPEPFAVSRIADRHAWLAGFMCALPDSSDLEPGPASLPDEFGSG
jgi:hypothetical protein